MNRIDRMLAIMGIFSKSGGQEDRVGAEE